MASQLENGLCCVQCCGGVYKNIIVNSVRVYDGTAESVIIASNDFVQLFISGGRKVFTWKVISLV